MDGAKSLLFAQRLLSGPRAWLSALACWGISIYECRLGWECCVGFWLHRHCPRYRQGSEMVHLARQLRLGLFLGVLAVMVVGRDARRGSGEEAARV